MTETLLNSLGPIGAILVAAGAYILRLHKSLQDSQEARVRDAQGVTSKILELVEQQTQDRQKLAEAINANTAAVQSLRERLHPQVR